MRLFVIAVLSLIFFTGCANMDLMSKIPEAQFKTFEYDRGGNVTSAHVEAKNSRIEDGKIKIEELSIKSDYGPAVNFKIKITGYERELSKDEH